MSEYDSLKLQKDELLARKSERDRSDAARSYAQGSQAAWRYMLGECMRHLDIDLTDPEHVLSRLVAERLDTLFALRRVCENYADNDWPDTANLGDVVSKLENYLERNAKIKA
jgi:hypothetical protein